MSYKCEACKDTGVYQGLLTLEPCRECNGGMPKMLIAGDVMNETGFTDDPHRTSASRPVRLEPEQRRQIIAWFQQQYG